MLEYLSVIFGDHVGPIYLGGLSNPIVHDIFEKFNVVVISIAIIIISYVSLSSTVNTAQDGKVMGKRWSFSWISIRTLLGVSLLVPLPGAGYSLIQSGGVWLAIQGSNFATQTLSIAIDYFSQGVSISRAAVLEETQKIKLKKQGEELSWDLFRSAICMASLQRISHDQAMNSYYDAILASSFVNQYGKLVFPTRTSPLLIAANKDGADYEGYFNIGFKSSEVPDLLKNEYARLCGSYRARAVVTTNEFDNGSTLNVNSYAKEAINKKLFALYAIFNHIRPLAERIVAHQGDVKHYNIFIKEQINDASNIYVDILSDLMKSRRDSKTTEFYTILEKLKQFDWVGMGALYANFGEAPKVELLETAKVAPSPIVLLDTEESTVPSCQPRNLSVIEDKIGISSLGYLQKYLGTKPENYFLCEKLIVVDNAFKDTHSVLPTTQVLSSTNTLSSIATMMPEFRQLIAKTKITVGNNPIALQSSFGNKLIATAEEQLEKSQGSILTLAKIVPLLLWLSGIVLAFYVPLMPCIIYTTSVIGWFVLVIQSFFVLPILALNLIMPSNDLLGKLAKDLVLPAEIVIRPVLMVVNFILAIRLYKIGVEFINLIMLNTITMDFLGASKIASVIGIIIYVLLTLITINICFSLFYKISNIISTAIQNGLTSSEFQSFSNTEVQTFANTAQTVIDAKNNLSDENKKSADVDTGKFSDPSGLSNNNFDREK